MQLENTGRIDAAAVVDGIGADGFMATWKYLLEVRNLLHDRRCVVRDSNSGLPAAVTTR